jgi:phosphopantothenoylcysteine synthetase/decarboxylase
VRVLITAGGTEEPIDGVRSLTNTSTGATGATLARHFAEHGADVLLLHAARSIPETDGLWSETFVTFADLESALRHRLEYEHWDAVIHCAAVSDYSVASVAVDGEDVDEPGRTKIASGRDVVIRLSPNPKLIDLLKTWSSNPDVTIVGFKLTNDPDPNARRTHVLALLGRGTTDLVVHNDLTEIDGSSHRAEIWTADEPIVRTTTKDELSEALWGLIHPSGRSHAGKPEKNP